MYDRMKSVLEQVTITQLFIGLMIMTFIISTTISYVASQYMYYDIIEQKIIREKAKRLSDRMATTKVAILFYYSTSS